MKRIVLVCILALAALGLLVVFALQSRSMRLEVHIAQHTVGTEVERLSEEYSTLLTSLESAWRDTQIPGDGVRALESRLTAAPERLQPPLLEIPGSFSQRERMRNSFENFKSTVAQASELANTLIDQQTAYAESVTYLRDAGPQIIQQMRDIRLNRVAADMFQLIVGTVDYATPESETREYELRRLLVTLGRDQRLDANMPTEVDRLLSSVTTILDTKSAIRSRLTQLGETPVINQAVNVGLAVSDAYSSAVAGGDRARLMLAIYAIVLLLAVGVIAFRLHHSYRDLNSANAELGSLNESLEHRVSERTEALSNTLSDLKESQVQLVQAEKMSSLGQLVAGISHEINTPLLYLANNATLIQERVELMSTFVARSAKAFSLRPEDFKDRNVYQMEFVNALKELKIMLRDEELEATLEEARDLVKDSIEGLADLTEMAQSLKDFSRLDRAPVGSFDVNAGLDKTLIIARNIIKHKADVHKFYGDIPEIECSPSQVNQVFLNLITNAAQAIDHHGEIVLTTKMVGDDRVAIAISDTGCGISTENMGKIRDPFFTTKEVGTGTGLGLSIVDEIIRGHGGDLKIESQVGKGSTFTVFLPVKQATAASSGAASAVEENKFADDEQFAEAV